MSELLHRSWDATSLGVVGGFRGLLGIEVIEIAEELVEAVHGGQCCASLFLHMAAAFPLRLIRV